MRHNGWLKGLGAVLLVNTILVMTTSFWHLATAREEPANGQASPAPDASTDQVEQLDESEDSRLELNVENAPPIGTQPSLDDLEAPELPEVPSLDSETLKNDPVFQEFQEMFGARRESENSDTSEAEFFEQERDSLAPAWDRDRNMEDSAPDRNAFRRRHTAPPTFTADYFGTIDTRLETIQNLVASARGLSAEASLAAGRHNHLQATKLMNMADELRSMAAQLLQTDEDL